MAASSTPCSLYPSLSKTDFSRDAEQKVELKTPSRPVEIEQDIKEVATLPFEVRLEDVDHENGQLCSPTIIQARDQVLAGYSDTRINKHHLRAVLKDFGFADSVLKYANIRQNGIDYTPYLGENWGKQFYGVDAKNSFLAGKGSFGKVKVVGSCQGWFADKTFKTKQSIAKHDELVYEIKMLEIQKLLLFAREIPSSKKNQKVHVVQKFMYHCDLHSALRGHLGIKPHAFYRDKPRYIATLLSFVKELKSFHNSRLIHRDIKKPNLRWNVLTSSLNLIDFGLACPDDGRPRILAGTIGLLAPEIIFQLCKRSFAVYTKESDIFAAGVVLLEVNAGLAAFDAKLQVVLEKIFVGMIAAIPGYSYKKCIALLKLSKFGQKHLSQFTLLQSSANEKVRSSLESIIANLESLLLKYPIDMTITELEIASFYEDPSEALKQLEKHQGVIYILDKNKSHNFREHFSCQRTLIQHGFKIAYQEFPDSEKQNLNRISNHDRCYILQLIKNELQNNKKNEFNKRLIHLKNLFALDRMRFYPELQAELQHCLEVAPSQCCSALFASPNISSFFSFKKKLEDKDLPVSKFKKKH